MILSIVIALVIFYWVLPPALAVLWLFLQGMWEGLCDMLDWIIRALLLLINLVLWFAGRLLYLLDTPFRALDRRRARVRAHGQKIG